MVDGTYQIVHRSLRSALSPPSLRGSDMVFGFSDGCFGLESWQGGSEVMRRKNR